MGLSIMMKNSNVMNCTVRVRKLPSPRPESPKLPPQMLLSPRPESPKLPPQIDIFDLLLNGKSTKKVQLVKEKPKEIIKTSDKTTSEKITEDMEKDAKKIKPSEKIIDDKKAKEVQVVKEKSKEINITSDQTSDKTKTKTKIRLTK